MSEQTLVAVQTVNGSEYRILHCPDNAWARHFRLCVNGRDTASFATLDEAKAAIPAPSTVLVFKCSECAHTTTTAYAMFDKGTGKMKCRTLRWCFHCNEWRAMAIVPKVDNAR